MDIQLEQVILNSFVITISNDRYKHFIDNFKKANFNVVSLPKRFPGFTFKNILRKDSIKTPVNVINCCMSHLAIVKMAQALDLPFVCIFEDDAYFCNDIANNMSKYLIGIPANANILKLGWTVTKDKPIKHVTSLLDIRSTFGAHAYIVFKQFYSKYELLFNNEICSDNKIFDFENVLCIKLNLIIQYNNSNDVLHNKKNLDFILKKSGIDKKLFKF